MVLLNIEVITRSSIDVGTLMIPGLRIYRDPCGREMMEYSFVTQDEPKLLALNLSFKSVSDNNKSCAHVCR